MESYETPLKPHEKIFIRILVGMQVSTDQICGIMAMLKNNKPAMDEVVAFIKANPDATEPQIIKAASRAAGVKSRSEMK